MVLAKLDILATEGMVPMVQAVVTIRASTGMADTMVKVVVKVISLTITVINRLPLRQDQALRLHRPSLLMWVMGGGKLVGQVGALILEKKRWWMKSTGYGHSAVCQH
jgi:hypothetical protein